MKLFGRVTKGGSYVRRKLGILILVFLFLGSISGCSGTGNETIPVETFPEEPNSHPLITDPGSIIDNTSQTDGELPILTEPSSEGTTETSDSGSSESSEASTESTQPTETGGSTQPPESTDRTEQPTESDIPSDPTEPSTYETVPPSEDGSVVLEEGKLSFSSCGRYSGAFVEDGSDRYVENVAAILVTNRTEEYLTYAALEFEINGVAASFVLTGLPAGASAWVLEYSAMEIGAGAKFVALDSVMQFIPQEPMDALEVVLKDGLLSARNLTDRDYIDGYIYYKQLHTDGNYLGGITYRTAIGDLPAGQTIEVTAGHAKGEGCTVVRITENPT